MKTMKSLLYFPIVCLVAFASCTNAREKTIQNIKLGIETETTASVKYAAFSQKAAVEGLDTIAKLFMATSKAEAIHASNHAMVLKSFKTEMDKFTPTFEVNSTAENLVESIEDESYEVNSMYPMFIEDATTKKLKKATIESLTWALASEKKHIEMFKRALYALSNRTVYNLPFLYFVCPVCGNTFDQMSVTDTCDLCGANRELFLRIN